MIDIIEIDDFKKKLEKLPKHIIKLYSKQKNVFTVNWLDGKLHAKKLADMNGYSFRITINYRVLFYFYDNKTVIFVSIGHRKDIYN